MISSQQLPPAMPQDKESERIVLGSCFTDASAYAQIGQILIADDFSLERHRRIFRAIGAMQERGETVSYGNVFLELKAYAQAESDLLSYLADLSDVPVLVNLESYCRAVKECSVRRQVITNCSKLIDRCQRSVDQESSLSYLERMREVLCSNTQRLAARSYSEVVSDEGGMVAFLSPDTNPGIRLPFSTVNDTLDGLRNQCFTILGARPSVGKSAMAFQIAEHAAISGNTVLYVTLEMGAQRVLHRSIAGRAQVSSYKFRRGHLNQDEKYSVSSEATQFAAFGDRILIVDDARTTAQGVESLIRAFAARNVKVDLVIIDYLQLMHSTGKFENRVQEVSAISRALKRITMSFDIPVLALSQLSRKEGAEPELSWLRETGALEQDADQVMFLWIKDEVGQDFKKDREIQWKVSKNRDGMLNRGSLMFYSKFCRFEEQQDDAHTYPSF